MVLDPNISDDERIPGIRSPTDAEVTTQAGQAQTLSRSAFDFFFRQTAIQGHDLGASNGPQFETFAIPKQKSVIGWKITFMDVRGGLNRVVGDYDRDYDRASSSTLETRGYRSLILPALVTAATTPDPTVGANSVMSYANVFDTLMIGVGSATGSQLFSETSATNPAIVAAASYNVGVEISNIGSAVLGGATQPERLIVHHTGANSPRVVSAAVGTIAGTMTGVTGPSWGHIQTPLNDDTILIYANGKIQGLTKSAAITATPTDLLNNVNNGGYPLGLMNLGSSRLRTWWVWPKDANLTVSMLGRGAVHPGRIYSTSLEGFDPQPLYMGLDEIYWAVLTRNGIVASDFKRVVFHDGRTLRDLGEYRDRSLNSDKELRARSGWVSGGDLYVEVNERASTNGTGNTRRWVEAYNFQYGTWHAVSTATQLSTTGDLTHAGVGGLPVSNTTGFIHGYADGSWYRQFTPPFGIDLFSQRQSSGAQSTTGVQFAAGPETWTSPRLTLPGRLSLYPSLITHIIYDGDVRAGGTNALVAVTAGGVTARFRDPGRQQPQVAAFPGNNSVFYELTVSATLTQGTNTYMTPNALPFTIYGVTFIDEFAAPKRPPAPR